MAPPGRRRPHPIFLPLTLLFILLTTLPALTSAAGSTVLGIDLGTEFFKAALVKPGIPLEIVLTKDSKRKESASVAFKASTVGSADGEFPERFYGSDAVALAARFPDEVYANLKVLLGIQFEEDGLGVKGQAKERTLRSGEGVVAMYSDRYPGLRVERAPGDRGTIAIRSGKLGEEEGKEAFLVEELLAMQLKEIKANAEALAGNGAKIQDAVITIPAFYTAEEKRSVILAAELAGLEVDSLISDGLAVGLNYATSRTFPDVSAGLDPEYHVVFDMGAGSTTATVLRFQSRAVKDVGRFNKTIQEVQVVGSAWDQSLGGDALNQLIVDDMVAKFFESSSSKLKEGTTVADIRSHGRTMAKLWTQSEKVRHVLSANSDTQTSFESLYQEDVNFKYKITRAEFEELAKHHAERVGAPLTRALAIAGLDLDKIESIILHGGAIRTPFVQKQLEGVAKGSGKLRTNVNADEAAVFGAAFRGAALSPSFRVKEIRAGDAPGFKSGIEWLSGDKEERKDLFGAFEPLGTETELSFAELQDFDFSFFHKLPKPGGTTDVPLSKVQTKNLTASVTKLGDKFGCAAADISTKFTVRLNPIHGLPEVVKGSVSCEVDDEKKGGVVEDVKGFFGLGSKKDQEPLQEGEEASTESSSTSTAASEEETATSTTSASSKETKKAVAETGPKIESIGVSFVTTPLGIPQLSEAEDRRIKNRLAAFDESDNARLKREEALNTLEAFIYRSQDLVEDEGFIKAVTEETLASLNEKLAASSDWLYGDGLDAKTKDFEAKLKELTDIVEPAVKRRYENEHRDAKMKTVRDTISTTDTLLKVMKEHIETVEEKFSSSLAEASLSSAEEASSTTSAPSDAETPDAEDLEEDSSSSSTKTKTTTTPSPEPTPAYTLYTPADYSSLSKAHESVSAWFEKQSKLQEELKETDDPVITVDEMTKRLGDLERPLQRIWKKMGEAAGEGKKEKDTKKEKKETKKDKEKKKEKEEKKKEAEKAKEEKKEEEPKDEL
ncbi:lumenal Hsp70 protein [Arachnomyces sp. PD_36]|nr:lumenal Hsp70 protein [Arachnomyces sp. PD_36]